MIAKMISQIEMSQIMFGSQPVFFAMCAARRIPASIAAAIQIPYRAIEKLPMLMDCGTSFK